MKVLLINPPTHFREPGRRRVLDTAPLGLLYVARALLDAGHQVQVLDIFAEELGLGQVEGRLRVLRGRVDAVGISAMSVQYAYVKWLAAAAKKELGDVPVILGGALAIFSSEPVLKNTAVDIAVTGEGERTVVELLSAGRPDGVRGVAFRRDGEVRATDPADLIRDLDSLGYPAYELLPLDIYRRALRFRMRIPWKDGTSRDTEVSYLCVSGGRGCAFRCEFCSRCFPGMRLRSVDSIVKEVEHFRKAWGVNGVTFMDELALVNRARAQELAAKLGPLDLHWTGNGRVGTFDKPLFEELRRSGCFQVTFGVESGSQRILDAMGKKQSREKARKVLKQALEAKVLPNVQMIFGYPGEDAASLKETEDFFRDLPVDVGFAILTPLPGSALYDRCRKDGRIPDEDAYLSGLESGFQVLRLNLTGWSDADFLRLRRGLTDRINRRAGRLRHGWLGHLLRRAKSALKP